MRRRVRGEWQEEEGEVKDDEKVYENGNCSIRW